MAVGGVRFQKQKVTPTCAHHSFTGRVILATAKAINTVEPLGSPFLTT